MQGALAAGKERNFRTIGPMTSPGRGHILFSAVGPEFEVTPMALVSRQCFDTARRASRLSINQVLFHYYIFYSYCIVKNPSVCKPMLVI